MVSRRSPVRLSLLSRRALSVAVLSVLLGAPEFVAAQITPDPNAGAHRPRIDAAANGVPVVNLTAPSAAGVSHNQYSQFNVDSRGVILNNNAGVSQTQLAGYLVGNPNYPAGQSARLIVNEVTSTNPTYLRGYTEVAGSAADVVISNPNGISVDGGGFINTPRATLTTGVPVFGSDGSLSALRATRGTITIDGAGLNASNIDRLDLIARSLTVNGGVWAHNLNIVAGPNQVDYAGLSAQALAGDGAAPAVNIDVAVLGGMYANRIYLTSSADGGIGVRNAGTLATQSGDFTITSAGQLQLTGTTASAGSLTIHGSGVSNSGALQATGPLAVQTTGELSNTGTVYSAGDLTLTAGGVLRNSNVIAAANNATLMAQQLASVGTLGAGIAADGSLQGRGALTVITSGNVAANGRTLAAGAITLQGNTLDLSGAQTQAGGDIALTATAGDIDHRNATLVTAGALAVNAAGTVDTGNATLQVGQLTAQAAAWRNAYGSVMQTGDGPMNMQIAGLLDNTHGVWAANAQAMTLHAAALDNTDGVIEQAGTDTLRLTTDTLTNTRGQIVSHGNLAIAAGTFTNDTGMVVAGDDLTLQSSDLSNYNGTLYSAQNFTWTDADATLDNTNGSLGVGGNLLLALGTVHNDGGDIAANGDVTAQFTTFDGIGRLRAGHDLWLTLAGDYTNRAGNTLFANGDVTFTLGGTFTNATDATLQSAGALTVNAARLDNQAGADINSQRTTLTAATQTNAGRIEGNTVTLTGGDITNTGTVIGDAITLNANNLTNGADLGIVTDNVPYQTALIAAVDSLNLYVKGTVLNRDATLYTLGDMTLAADASGARNASILNLSGDIEAGGDVFLATNQFTNQRRVFETSVYTLTPAEQAQNTTTFTLARYLWNGGADNHTLPAPPDADPSQLLDSGEFAQATAFCDGLNARTDTQRCAGYPFGVGSPNTFQGVYTTTLTSVTRIAATSAESRLLAGGTLTINGSVLNDKATMAAGNALLINGEDGNAGGGNVGSDTVQNIAWVPTGTVVTTLQEQSATQQLQNDPRAWIDGPWMTYGTQTLTDTLALGTGQAPAWITVATDAPVSAVMSAGNGVAIGGHTIDNTVVGSDGQPVTGVGLDHPGAQLIGTPQQPYPVQLPGNGLYTVHAGSGSTYLIETDPRFASTTGFLGSDYLLTHLGLDGDATLKRLGDAFYETQLVMDQITSLTGRRYLEGSTDALDQYKALMDAGAQEAAQFDLAVGVALTPEQIASLTQDMVWLVNETVDGEQVLVPVVYLSQSTASQTASGAVIQGSTVNLTASDQLTNTGTIQASQDVTLTANNLLNAGNLVAGGTLNVQAAQDLLTVGRIQGGNVQLAAGNNLTSTATTGNVSLGTVNLSGLNAPQLGTPTGGQLTATGTLVAQAGNDLNFDHATVSAGSNLALAAGNDLNATASMISAGNSAQLIAGHDINLNAAATTQRQGTQANGTASTTHTVTTITAGGSALLAAGHDLTSQGAQITAADQLALSAGHDIVLNAVTDSASKTSESVNGHTITGTGQVDETLRGTHLDAANGVALSAGHDLSSVAGTLTSDNGTVALAAGHGINLIAGQETHSRFQNTVTAQSGLLSSSKTTTQDASRDTYAVGTTLGGNTVSLAAGHDLNAQAAYVNADHAVMLAAGHDVTLTDAHDTHSEAHSTETSRFDFFSTSSKRFGSVDPEWRDNASSVAINQSTSVGSVLSGDSVTVAAGNNLTATKAQIVATNDVLLAAGHNLTLNAGQNTYDDTQDHRTRHTGLMNNGGLSVLIGNRSTTDTASEHDVTYTGSTVGSLTGSVTLSAGNDVHITGSDVLSNVGTAIVGKNVTIDAAVGSTDITQTQKVSTGGINVGIGGAAVQLANAAYYGAHRSGDVKDDRLKALYVAQSAYQARDAYNAAEDGVSQNGTDKGINLQIGIGGSSASSRTATHDDTTYGSTIRSNGNVTIAATGGDLNIIGSQVAGQDVALAATNDLNILSQAESHTLQSNNQNFSAGVGLQIGSDGMGIYAQAAVGKANAHGNGTTHTDSTVNANGMLTLVSGNDTTIKGAQLTGNQVTAVIGNNLVIQSEQDTDDYASKQWQANGKVVIGIGGGGSGSVGYSQSNMNSHYQGVTEVTGIRAGDAGFDITVGGNTHLIGGVIASSADPSKNLLDTGSLSYESLHNEADYSASSWGVGNSFGVTVPQDGNSSSDTKSGVAQGTIIQRDGNTNLSGLDRYLTLDSQALKPIFDAQKVQENIELGNAAGYVGMRTAGSISNYMYTQAAANGDKAGMAAWDDGGINSTILHGLVGAATAALGGGKALQGGLGAAAGEAAGKAMAQWLYDNKIDPNSAEGKAFMTLASTAIGGAVGGGSGATTALQGELYNRQLHPNYVKHLQGEAATFAAKQCGCDLNSLSADDRQAAIDNAANTLIVTAQRLQDDAFNLKYGDASLDASAIAFLNQDNYGEWIGGKYYDMAHADAYERSNPTINAYALYAYLNLPGNGGLDALMPATGYTLSQYAALANSDYNSGRPQGQAFDLGFQQWQKADSVDFLKFNGQIALMGGSFGLAAGGTPFLLSATAARQTVTSAPLLQYMLTTRAGVGITSGAINAASQLIQKKPGDPFYWTDVGASVFTGFFGVGGNLGWNMALNASGGAVQTQLNNWIYGQNNSVIAGGIISGVSGAAGYNFSEGVTSGLSGQYPKSLIPVILGGASGSVGSEGAQGVINAMQDSVNKKIKDNRVGQ